MGLAVQAERRGGDRGGVSATWQRQLLAVRATCAAQTLTLAPKLTCNCPGAQPLPGQHRTGQTETVQARLNRVRKPKPSQNQSHSQVQTVIAACELTSVLRTLPPGLPRPTAICVCVCGCAVCIQVLCLHLLSLWRFSAKLSKFEHK